MDLKAEILDRVIGSGKVSTIVGTILGAAINGAAARFTSTGDIANWQGYAIAAGGAAVTAGCMMLRGKR